MSAHICNFNLPAGVSVRDLEEDDLSADERIEKLYEADDLRHERRRDDEQHREAV